MAIINPNKKPYKNDENNNIFIGIDLPIRKGNGPEGFFVSTKTTLEAIKNNIRSLLLTNSGERLMQPTLGLNLRKYLFEQMDDDAKSTMKAEIVDKFKFWLPFVEINDLKISMSRNDDIGKNQMNIKVIYKVLKNINSMQSVTVEIK
tara:strand:- start:160 stop:600 length:441 start_codon:yes stop_codon:yes gene_type:complete